MLVDRCFLKQISEWLCELSEMGDHVLNVTNVTKEAFDIRLALWCAYALNLTNSRVDGSYTANRNFMTNPFNSCLIERTVDPIKGVVVGLKMSKYGMDVIKVLHRVKK